MVELENVSVVIDVNDILEKDVEYFLDWINLKKYREVFICCGVVRVKDFFDLGDDKLVEIGFN